MPFTTRWKKHKAHAHPFSIELSSQLSVNTAGNWRPETSDSTVTGSKREQDVIVDWEGPEDPSNPRNWTPRAKLIQVVIISVYTFAAGVATIIFAPAAPALIADFAITNPLARAATVSIYVLGVCFGPLLMAPLSEIYGRPVVYRVSCLVYQVATAGCALSVNATMFLACRFLAGCAGAAPMAIAAGTIADMYVPEARGVAMALFSLGPSLGPIIGPIIGGFIAHYTSWRWVFWFIFILSGLSSISTVFLKETYEPVLLARKAASLRNTSGNHALRPRTALENISHLDRLRGSLMRPMKMLIFSPIVLLTSLYVAIFFGLQYLLYASYSSVFVDKFGWGANWTGLAFLGMGIGTLFAIGSIGAVSDKKFKKAKADGIVMKPEARLMPMLWTAPIVPLGFLWYGWSAQAENVHWIAPILGTSLIGYGGFAVLMPSQVYLVDAFGADASASAMAASTLLRSLFGAFMPMGGPPLYAALGLGWGNTVLALICLGFAPVPWLLIRYGERLRRHFPVDY